MLSLCSKGTFILAFQPSVTHSSLSVVLMVCLGVTGSPKVHYLDCDCSNTCSLTQGTVLLPIIPPTPLQGPCGGIVILPGPFLVARIALPFVESQGSQYIRRGLMSYSQEVSPPALPPQGPLLLFQFLVVMNQCLELF